MREGGWRRESRGGSQLKGLEGVEGKRGGRREMLGLGLGGLGGREVCGEWVSGFFFNWRRVRGGEMRVGAMEDGGEEGTYGIEERARRGWVLEKADTWVSWEEERRRVEREVRVVLRDNFILPLVFGFYWGVGRIRSTEL